MKNKYKIKIKEGEVEMENQKGNFYSEKIILLIREGSILVSEIVNIREHPSFLKIFSNEEVQEINQRERKILEVISDLEEFKFFSEADVRKINIEGRIRFLDNYFNKTKTFIENFRVKISAPSLYFWFIYPDLFYCYYLKDLFYKLYSSLLRKVKNRR